jgi:hypothetical protein
MSAGYIHFCWVYFFDRSLRALFIINFTTLLYRHVVFAPSSINTYDSSLFPGLHDAIISAISADSTHSARRWEEVKQQADVVAVHVRYATQIISEPSLRYFQGL